MGLIPKSFLRSKWLEAIGRIECGQLTFIEPSGERHVVSGPAEGPRATFQIHDWDVIDRAVARGDIGLGEDYIAGAWETDSIEALISLFLLQGWMDHDPDQRQSAVQALGETRGRRRLDR